MQMDPQQEDLGKSNPLGASFVLRKPILEVSAKKVVAIVDRVEQEYRMLYSKDLNFRQAKDFYRLAELVDFISEVKDSAIMIPGGNSKETIDSFMHYDLGHQFLKNYILREENILPSFDSPDKEKLVEGLMGMLDLSLIHI